MTIRLIVSGITGFLLYYLPLSRLLKIQISLVVLVVDFIIYVILPSQWMAVLANATLTLAILIVQNCYVCRLNDFFLLLIF